MIMIMIMIINIILYYNMIMILYKNNTSILLCCDSLTLLFTLLPLQLLTSSNIILTTDRTKILRSQTISQELAKNK